MTLCDDVKFILDLALISVDQLVEFESNANRQRLLKKKVRDAVRALLRFAFRHGATKRADASTRPQNPHS